jgi:two-component system, cell cycle response regulator DivK
MIKPLALVIEDEESVAELFALALQAAGFETEIALDGSAALSRLAEIVPVLVILDLHLPYVSGREILQQIRADERLTETKVILSSADVGMAENLRANVDFALSKPIGFIQLRDLAKSLHFSTPD